MIEKRLKDHYGARCKFEVHGTPTMAMVKDTASVGFYESLAGKKFARLQLTIDGLLNGTERAEHPDYGPDANFKNAKAERAAEQETLI